MITIICIVLMLIFIIDNRKCMDCADAALAIIIATLIGLLISLFTFMPFLHTTPDAKIVTHTIYKVNDTSYHTSNSHFYYVIEDIPDKGRKQSKININSTYINLIDENATPSIEYHYKEIGTNNIIRKLCCPFGWSEFVEDYHVLNIPNDSISMKGEK